MRPFSAVPSTLFALTLLATLPCTPICATAAPPIPKMTVNVELPKDPALASYLKGQQKLAEEWYPKIIKILGAEGQELPTSFTMHMDDEMKVPAAAGGDVIGYGTEYISKHLDDTGVIVHELTHVVQSYPRQKQPGVNAGWLVEGIADYVRWFNFEPKAARPHPKADKAHARDSYRVTGAFLDWAKRKYNPDLIKKLNASLHAGDYTDGIWKTLTGHDLDSLDTEWRATLPLGAPKPE